MRPLPFSLCPALKGSDGSKERWQATQARFLVRQVAFLMASGTVLEINFLRRGQLWGIELCHKCWQVSRAIMCYYASDSSQHVMMQDGFMQALVVYGFWSMAISASVAPISCYTSTWKSRHRRMVLWFLPAPPRIQRICFPQASYVVLHTYHTHISYLHDQAATLKHSRHSQFPWLGSWRSCGSLFHPSFFSAQSPEMELTQRWR